MIRYRTGWNDNPTCTQFVQSYKCLIVNKCIKNVNIGNVITLPEILTVSCSHKKINNNVPIDINEKNIHLNIIETDIDEYSCDILTYLAGYIQAKQMKKHLKCDMCYEIVKNSQIMDENLNLFIFKKWGNLMTPSKAIFVIIKETEKIFKIYVTAENFKNIYNVIVLRTMENIIFCNLLLCDPENHLKKREGLDTHEYMLIKLVIKIY